MKFSTWYQEAQLKCATKQKNIGELNLITQYYFEKQVNDMNVNYELNLTEIKELNHLLEGFLENIKPLAYQLNLEIFDNLVLYVDENVLIPRQESLEVVIKAEKLLRSTFSPGSEITIADVCTGSGVLLISLAKRLKNDYIIKLYATDISKNVLEIAKNNFMSHNLEVTILSGDMLEPLKNMNIDMIISNPPYVSLYEYVEPSVYDYEPHIALFASNEGLALYEKFIKQLSFFSYKPKLIVFEIGNQQAIKILNKILEYKLPYDGTHYKDLNNYDRIAILRKKIIFNEEEIISELKLGNVVGVPTDTVYGLACTLNNSDKIYSLKNRPTDKKLIRMIFSRKQLVINDEKLIKLMDDVWPGATTIIFSENNEFNGYRIPNEPNLLSLLKKIDEPLFVTSANISGEADILTKEDFEDQFPNIPMLDELQKVSKLNTPSRILLYNNNELTQLR